MFCGTTCRNQLFLNFIPTGLVCCLHQSTTSLEGLGSSLGSSLGSTLGSRRMLRIALSIYLEIASMAYLGKVVECVPIFTGRDVLSL